MGLLDVFDVGGRLLHTEQLPPGVHQRTFTADVPSCSLVRWQADGVTLTTKVLR